MPNVTLFVLTRSKTRKTRAGETIGTRCASSNRSLASSSSHTRPASLGIISVQRRPFALPGRLDELSGRIRVFQESARGSVMGNCTHIALLRKGCTVEQAVDEYLLRFYSSYCHAWTVDSECVERGFHCVSLDPKRSLQNSLNPY